MEAFESDLVVGGARAVLEMAGTYANGTYTIYVNGLQEGQSTTAKIPPSTGGLALARPGEETAATAQPREETLGLTVEALTPEASQRFKLTAKAGVVVTDVAPGSSGDQAGIRPGDAILEINRRPVTDVESFRKVIASVKPGEVVPVYVQRGGGRNEYVVLSVPDLKR